jgi:hypothetical protein
MKYLIVFKDLKKKLFAEAPSEERANEWAKVQLAQWKSESRFSVTQVVETPKEAEKQAQPDATKASVKKVKFPA